MQVSGNPFEPLFSALPPLGARMPEARSEHPALAWARSGAMALTGRADEPPRLAPAPLARRADAVLEALAALAPASRLADLARGASGSALLGERAAYLGLARRGAISAGGSCRLLRAADGWVAVSLAREDDRSLLPAWLDLAAGDARDPWAAVSERVAERSAAAVVERARLLGLAVSEAGAPAADPPPWLRVRTSGAWRGGASPSRPLVLDLSSLWAGPLCGRLLALAGARVVKVESVSRLDGARFGVPGFYAALNADKESLALDLSTPAGVGRLRALAERADAVIESARPRALAQLGIDAEALAAAGCVWVSITGHGRAAPGCDWIAYGDDAAAAAGLAAETGDPDAPLFCGDAIADPLTGLHAALAALAYLRAGCGALLDLSLRDVTAHCLGLGDARSGARVEAAGADFEVVAGGARAPVAAPRTVLPAGRVRALGADSESVLGELRVC